MRIPAARSAATWAGSPRPSRPLTGADCAASPRIGARAKPSERTDAAEIVVPARPAADSPPLALERGQPLLVDPRLGADDVVCPAEARPVNRDLRLDSLVQDGAKHADERGAQTRAARGAECQLEPAGVERERGSHHAGHAVAGTH